MILALQASGCLRAHVTIDRGISPSRPSGLVVANSAVARRVHSLATARCQQKPSVGGTCDPHRTFGKRARGRNRSAVSLDMVQFGETRCARPGKRSVPLAVIKIPISRILWWCELFVPPMTIQVFVKGNYPRQQHRRCRMPSGGGQGHVSCKSERGVTGQEVATSADGP